jgi:hypothetical protein
MMHTGALVAGRPSIGAWTAYGLGTGNQNLPTCVELSDARGLPVDGVRNWSSARGVSQGLKQRPALEKPSSFVPWLRGSWREILFGGRPPYSRRRSQVRPGVQVFESRTLPTESPNQIANCDFEKSVPVIQRR